MLKLNLHGKIFLFVAVVIFGVILTTFVMVNYFIRSRVFRTVTEDLQNARRVFEELAKVDYVRLVEKAWVVADAPRLKAAVDTQDPPTVQRLSEELLSTVNSDLFVVTSNQGCILSRIGKDAFFFRALVNDSLVRRTLRGEEGKELRKIGGGLYRVVAVPIVTSDPVSGLYILGGLILGFEVDDALAREFKDIIHSDVAFLYDGQVVASTLPPAPAALLGRLFTQVYDSVALSQNPTQVLTFQNEHYVALFAPLANSTAGHYAILHSLNSAMRPFMVPIQRALVAIGGLSFFIALAISYFISRSMAAPIGKLVKATDAVSAGNYDYRIKVTSRDEIGHLAEKFENMRVSLQNQMEELEQLNRRLRERNIELERALEELKRTQEELIRSEKLAAMGKLTAQLSHELNNPIHNVRSCLETARKKLSPESPGAEFLDIAHEEILRMSKLIRQMLDFHRPQPVDKVAIDVNQVLEEVLQSSRENLRQQGITLRTRFSPEIPTVLASKDQLKQVFLNIVLNAIEAMPRGGELSIMTEHRNGFVAIRFQDTGVGIEPEHLPKIFDAFFTTKSKVSGVGLGLSVSYGIVREHGGSIEVETEVGKGSTFKVRLPAHEIDQGNT